MPLIDTLRAGDSLAMTFNDGAHPSTAGYTGQLTLIPEAGGTAITIDATAAQDQYTIAYPGSNTSSWAAGLYNWFFSVSLGSDRFTVADGKIDILPSFTVLAGEDSRSIVKKTLDAIESLIQGKPASDVHEYTISSGGSSRSLTKMTWKELLEVKKYYQELYRRELTQEKIRTGQGGGTKVKVRF